MKYESKDERALREFEDLQVMKEERTVYEVPFLLDEARSAYVGKPNLCMCGCSGTYFYAEKYREESSNNRGYFVSDDEVHDAKVKRVYNKMVKNAHLGIEVIKDYIYTLVIGNTQYTIYLEDIA